MRFLACIALVACHASPRPPQSVEQRIDAAMAAWGTALRSGDAAQLTRTEDGYGQLVISYGATKWVASHVPDGDKAVEYTMAQLVLDELRYEPRPTTDVYLPTGELGPAVVATGLATPLEGTSLTYTALPLRQALVQINAAQDRHHERLREQRAWTCRRVRIEKTIERTNPIMTRLAALSKFWFAHWRDGLEAIWIVRARCADHDALFAITGQSSPNRSDLVLAAQLVPTETPTRWTKLSDSPSPRPK